MVFQRNHEQFSTKMMSLWPNLPLSRIYSSQRILTFEFLKKRWKKVVTSAKINLCQIVHLCTQVISSEFLFYRPARSGVIAFDFKENYFFSGCGCPYCSITLYLHSLEGKFFLSYKERVLRNSLPCSQIDSDEKGSGNKAGKVKHLHSEEHQTCILWTIAIFSFV